MKKAKRIILNKKVQLKILMHPSALLVHPKAYKVSIFQSSKTNDLQNAPSVQIKLQKKSIEVFKCFCDNVRRFEVQYFTFDQEFAQNSIVS